VNEVQERDDPRTHVHEGPAHTVHAHPGPAEYVKIALILAFVTAVEVALYYVERDTAMPDWVLFWSLIILSLVKFALVVLWFMHLKFDNKLFSAFFYGAMGMAILAFLVVMAMQRVFF
jgi:cytochrome c oxidase subunit IV